MPKGMILLDCGFLIKLGVIHQSPVGIDSRSIRPGGPLYPDPPPSQKKHLVGAGWEAGYDGKWSNKAITNEVQLLCPREHCLSNTSRRRVRRG